jgi:hypothetical protein
MTMRSAIFAGLGVLAAALLLVVVLALVRPTPLEDAHSVGRPAPGEARAVYLADGTPVWVIAHEGGGVSVLSGISTHIPFGVAKLTWWCPTSRALEDPFHGAKWDEYGVRLGGPAPGGLISRSTQTIGDRVVVGAARPAASMGQQPSGPSEAERDFCTGEDPVIVHTFAGWPIWESPREALAAASPDWILVAGRLAPQRNGAVALCALDGCADSVLADGVEVPPPDRFAFDPWPDELYLARVSDGRMVGLTRVIPDHGDE